MRSAFLAVFLFAGGFVCGAIADRSAYEWKQAYVAAMQCAREEAKFVSADTGVVLCFPLRHKDLLDDHHKGW